MQCESVIKGGPNKGVMCPCTARWEVTKLPHHDIRNEYTVCSMHLAELLQDLMKPYDEPYQVMRIDDEYAGKSRASRGGTGRPADTLSGTLFENSEA